MTNIYHQILDKDSTIREGNLRTKEVIRSIPKTVKIELPIKDNTIKIPTVRRVSTRVAAAEYAWFRSGSEFVKDLQKHNVHIWDKFADEEGKVRSSYGYRWVRHFNRNQIDLAIDALVKDPTNRQLWIATWDPMIDGLDSTYFFPQTPCEVGFQLRGYKGLFENTLDCTSYLRSSDLLVGLPYDILCKAYLLLDICKHTKMKPGTLTFILGNPHIYEKQLHYVEKGVEIYPEAEETIPLCARQKYELLPDFVNRAASVDIDWQTTYSPKIEVVV